uniref:Uncharacterized protein n=1 Tax=viral metagenome TaxID=1070528 RepID=A0A6M3K1T1_9ZZZZ
MSWTNPLTWTVGQIVTKALLDLHLRDNLRYLHGDDGVPTIKSGLEIDNTDGDEYVKLPLLSTAETGTVLDAEGKVAFDETTHQVKIHNGTAVKAVISEADVDDTPVNGATTVPVSSNWAYDFQQTLTTAGDLPYATGAGVWTRLAAGTVGHILSVAAGGAAPEWRAETARTNKLKSETRAMDAASGDVAYTGYGFQPTSLLVFAACNAYEVASWGLADVNLLEGCIYSKPTGTNEIDTNLIHIIELYDSKNQLAVLKTLDADGFTLTWTRTGATAAGTITFKVLALR